MLLRKVFVLLLINISNITNLYCSQLLVTTSKSLLLVDTETDTYFPLHQGDGVYYGISVMDEKFYVAAQMNDDDKKLPILGGQILVFDRSGKLCERLKAPFHMHDIHQIAWHEDKLYVSCTWNNMIAIYDGTNWEQWFPSPDFKQQYDINHFNSFFFERDIVWILAHNFGESELLGFSIANKKLVERIKMGFFAHNIWRENGQLYVCSSKDSKILGDNGFMLELHGWLRGVAFAENFRSIGSSQFAARDKRRTTDGRLLIFNNNWEKLKEIVLEGEGVVSDIMVVPGFSK